MEAENCYEIMVFIYQTPSFQSQEADVFLIVFFLAFFEIKTIH